jgi:hypothetical protein
MSRSPNGGNGRPINNNNSVCEFVARFFLRDLDQMGAPEKKYLAPFRGLI